VKNGGTCYWLDVFEKREKRNKNVLTNSSRADTIYEQNKEG
jgi:hypothetical protein